MDKYLKDHPSLDPLSSGKNDYPAPGVRAGDLMDDSHLIEAACQYMLLKVFAKSGDATDAEVRVAKKRKTGLEHSRYIDSICPRVDRHCKFSR
jgi:hypothetical protein